MNYSKRIERLRQAMQEAGIDGVVFGLGANYQYFTGSVAPWIREGEPLEPDHLLVVGREGLPTIITVGARVREIVPAEVNIQAAADRAEVICLLAGLLKGERFGVGRQAYAYLPQLVTEAIPGCECMEADGLGEQLRLIKEPDEIARLREVAGITDRTMTEILRRIDRGLSQARLQQMILDIGEEYGVQDVSFPPAGLYVKTGSLPSDNPFTYPKEEGLVMGTSIAFDFGFVLHGYCSDFGRSFYYGAAPAHIRGAYKALQEAQVHLISRLKPGLRIGDMPGILLAKLDESGYGDRFRARVPDGTLGHQIGVDLHENPWIKPETDTLLAPGMVMCIEPKVWSPGEYYLRVEDMVLITDDGAESLTGFDRDIFELYPTGA
jgi:Xaa-Pro aminopeptidase